MSTSAITKVDKPWGHELIFATTKDYVGKILFIRAGHALSLQFHRVKEETIFLQSGKMDFQLENDKGEVEHIILSPGMSQHILPNRKHRMTAVEDCLVFEVSTPHLNDVVRLDDRYGRQSGTGGV